MARRQIAPEVFLAGLPLFKALDAAARAELAAQATRRTLKRGEALFGQGEPATGMYLVVYGEIKLSQRTPAGGTRLCGLVRPGQSFGEPVMFLERPTLVAARAASDALLLHLPKAAVFDAIERHPGFARHMIAGLSQRIERLVEQIDRQALGSGTARFVAWLLRRAGTTQPLVLRLPAAKAEIASLLNLTPEHFSRVLQQLAGAGLLQVQGRTITVPDRHRLEAAVRRR
ncbi:MAG: Crp/Fnr family transcriptional regulator [Burkholderiales bacterium]|nr:Crp/Fnr family transcriptional regulator [Burkholderiales bacterium]